MYIIIIIIIVYYAEFTDITVDVTVTDADSTTVLVPYYPIGDDVCLTR